MCKTKCNICKCKSQPESSMKIIWGRKPKQSNLIWPPVKKENLSQ